MEVEEAQSHYTETLHLFETFPTWQPRITPPAPAERSDFGLPEQGALYIAPHRLPKFHPDMDALLAGVLDADPTGHIVLLPGKHPRPAALLRERFARTLGKAAERVLWLSPESTADYYRLLSLADVLLDTLHYSAGLVGHDAFSLHLPIVTLPGEFNVGRYTLGYYRRIGIDKLIVSTPSEYVAQAVRVATDRDYQQHLRRLLAERSSVLFEDRQAVDAHEAFFEQALSETH
jgi:predicted O-linked N-acetylglucosamine transferase (SPINDLY family)